MAGKSRSEVINLPITILLTEEGVDFFMKNGRHLAKLKTADSFESYGFTLSKLKPQSLQRLILANYVSKLEVSGTDLIGERQKILDLSKCVSYSYLYEKFDCEIRRALINSRVIQNWNRANPSGVIDENTRTNEAYLRRAIKENQAQLDSIIEEIRVPVLLKIEENQSLLEEEKDICRLMTSRFLESIRPFTWFVLLRFRGIEDCAVLLQEFSRLLLVYIEKARIPEYLTLIILELVSYLQNANLRRFIAKAYRNAGDPDTLLSNENIRTSVLERLSAIDERIFLDWRIRSGGSTIGTQNKLQVTIYNHLGEYQSFRDSINNKKSIDLKEKSLLEFYQGNHESIAGNELGLYYLSYLNQACEKVGIKFESSVNQLASRELTAVMLSFIF